MSSNDHPDLMGPLWDGYQQQAYGHLLPPGDQHTECKRAFYGGAFQSLTALAHLASDDEQPTDADMELIDQLMGEVHAFFQAESAIHNARKN